MFVVMASTTASLSTRYAVLARLTIKNSVAYLRIEILNVYLLSVESCPTRQRNFRFLEV